MALTILLTTIGGFVVFYVLNEIIQPAFLRDFMAKSYKTKIFQKTFLGICQKRFKYSKMEPSSLKKLMNLHFKLFFYKKTVTVVQLNYFHTNNGCRDICTVSRYIVQCYSHEWIKLSCIVLILSYLWLK